MIWKDDTSPVEETFNTATQAVGVILGTIALIFLVQPHPNGGNPDRMFGNIIYGVTLIMMFLISGLFHGLYFTKAYKVMFIIDHASIFLFMAGSFTPFTMAFLHGNVQTISLVLTWLLCLSGIILAVYFKTLTKILLFVYLAFGWLGLVFLYPMLLQLQPEYLYLFVAGGLSFTVGTVFLRWRKLQFHHGIWHIFIMVGCVLHFITIIHL
jgi:hemolysin III